MFEQGIKEPNLMRICSTLFCWAQSLQVTLTDLRVILPKNIAKTFWFNLKWADWNLMFE